MNTTTPSLLLLLAAGSLLCGCATPVSYAPGCLAYAGDRITIGGQRYTWDKFTDVRRIDEAGEVIDPFPGYPRQGRVERDGRVLRFLDESGALLAVRHLHEAGGKTYLLTPEAWREVAAGAAPDPCALVAAPSEEGG